MTGHYLNTAQDAADSAARSDRANTAAQHRNDATRHDVAAVAGSGCSVSTWYNDTKQTWGCDVMNSQGVRVGGGCGWRMASEADAAGWAMIEEGV